MSTTPKPAAPKAPALVPIRLRSAMDLSTAGWVARMMRQGWRVLHRPAPFGRTVWCVKRPRVPSVFFTQGRNVSMRGAVPARVAAALRESGVTC